MKTFQDIKNIIELSCFLHKKAENGQNRLFYQYTDINGLFGMIKSKKLHLTCGKYMNDLHECHLGKEELWERTYIASFTFEHHESIAMWCIYSRQLKNALRIRFQPQEIQKLDKSSSVYEVKKIGNSFSYSNFCEVKSIKLTHVGYFDKYTLLWNDEKLKQPVDASFSTWLTAISLHGCIKDAAWAYEKEIRLKIVLPKGLSYYPYTIAIDAPSLLDRAEIKCGPCLDKERLIHKIEIAKSKSKKMIVPEFGEISQSCLLGKVHLKAKCAQCCYKTKTTCPYEKLILGGKSSKP